MSIQVRLWVFVLEYNMGSFLRRPTLTGKIKRWYLSGLLVKLIKNGGKVVEHGRYLKFECKRSLRSPQDV
jgi:hypothetical protein